MINCFFGHFLGFVIDISMTEHKTCSKIWEIFLPVAHRSRDTQNGSSGGGGGAYIHKFCSKKDFFN